MGRLIPALAGLAAGVTVSSMLVAPAHAASDEDRVRTVLYGMNGAYNRSDFASFAERVCASMRQADGFEEQWHASRQADGPTRISVDSVTVTGSPGISAVATVRFAAANQPIVKIFDIDFLREGSDWKACRYRAARST